MSQKSKDITLYFFRCAKLSITIRRARGGLTRPRFGRRIGARRKRAPTRQNASEQSNEKHSHPRHPRAANGARRRAHRRRRPFALSAPNRRRPNVERRRRIRIGRALATRQRHRSRAPTRAFAFAPRRLALAQLFGLRTRARRSHPRRQCRLDESRQALRSQQRRALGHFRLVLDSRRNARVHFAQLAPRQNRHDQGATQIVF